MVFIRHIKESSSILCVLPKLSKFHQRSINYKQIWLPNHLIRWNYCTNSVKEIKIRAKYNFYEEHKIFSKLFPNKEKFPVNNNMAVILSEIFQTDKKKFAELKLHPKHLGELSEAQLRNTARYLRELNFTMDHIISSPWILLLTEENIVAKTPLIKDTFLFESIHDGLGFTLFHPKLITKYSKKFEAEKEFNPFRNRIYYIGGKLNIPINILTLKLTHAWEILHMRKSKIDGVINLLEEFNYNTDDVIDNIWVFKSGYNCARERLLKLQEIGIHQPKLYVWRTSHMKFARFYSQAKKYGSCDHDWTKVLREELHLSEYERVRFMSKAKIHGKIDSELLSYKIKRYKEAGLIKKHFMKYPQLLLMSEEQVLERIKLLKENNIFDLSNFRVILCSDNMFNRNIKRILETKEKGC